MVGWHHRLNGHEFEQAQGDGEGQGGLACCSSQCHRESDTTQQLNNNQHSSLWQDFFFFNQKICKVTDTGLFSKTHNLKYLVMK